MPRCFQRFNSPRAPPAAGHDWAIVTTVEENTGNIKLRNRKAMRGIDWVHGADS
jgi:hypothetical protein